MDFVADVWKKEFYTLSDKNMYKHRFVEQGHKNQESVLFHL